MDNIKDRNYFINKVLEYLYEIKLFINNISYEEFENDKMLQSAICFQYIQAFEYAKNLNQNEFDKKFENTLIKLRGFRNLIVHEYGKIDTESVYKTSVNDVPVFIKDLEEELKWKY